MTLTRSKLIPAWQNKIMKIKQLIKQLTFWLAILILIILALFEYRNGEQPKELTYSEFWGKVKTGEVAQITIQDAKITGKFRTKKEFTTQILDGMGTDITKELNTYNDTAPLDKQIKYEVKRSTQV